MIRGENRTDNTSREIHAIRPMLAGSHIRNRVRPGYRNDQAEIQIVFAHPISTVELGNSHLGELDGLKHQGDEISAP